MPTAGVSDTRNVRIAIAVDRNRKTVTARRRTGGMSDYLVGMEAAWLVREVGSVDDAIGVAVSEAGRRLNDAGLEYVEVEVGATGCPACGEPFDSAFVAAGTAIVALTLEMEIFDADGEDHAARIAKSEVGPALQDTPIEVVHTAELDDEEE